MSEQELPKTICEASGHSPVSVWIDGKLTTICGICRTQLS